MSEEWDGPIEAVAKEAEKAMQKGGLVFQKFTCAGCGARQTMPDEGVFFRRGKCEECGHVTELTQCGFTAIFGDQSLDAVLKTLQK